MTPRVVARVPSRRPSSSLEEFRSHIAGGDSYGDPETTAFWRWALMPTPAGNDPRELLDEAEQRVLSKATGAAGGYAVPQDMYEMVVGAARASSALAQLALEFLTDSGETFLVPTATTHGTAAWTAESAALTASDEIFGQASLGAYKANALVIASEELAEDSAVPFDQYLALELGSRLGDLEDIAFSVGSGTGQPLGIVNAGSPYSVVTAAVGSSLLYKLADVLAVYKALPAVYRPQASWIMHPDDYASLAGTADTAGALAFPSLQNDPPSLFGRPVLLGAAMPTPAASAKSLAFGDWKRAYGIRRAKGVGLTKQSELYAATGQLGFRAYERVDGRPLLTDAARILAHSAT